jgi:hypothetical protein
MRDALTLTAFEFECRRQQLADAIAADNRYIQAWKPLAKRLRLVVCSERSLLFRTCEEAAEWLCGRRNRSIVQGICRASRSEDGRAYKGYHWTMLPPVRVTHVDSVSPDADSVPTTAIIPLHSNPHGLSEGSPQ